MMETYTSNIYTKRVIIGELQVINQNLSREFTGWSSEVKKEVISKLLTASLTTLRCPARPSPSR